MGVARQRESVNCTFTLVFLIYVRMNAALVSIDYRLVLSFFMPSCTFS